MLIWQLTTEQTRWGQTTPQKDYYAKFKYLLHFFSFLDQTRQIDCDCWPNDIKFCLTQNVKLWRHNGWRHQNGVNKVFNFKVKLISSERALEEEKFHPPEPYFFLKNDPYDIFPQVFRPAFIFRRNNYQQDIFKGI